MNEEFIKAVFKVGVGWTAALASPLFTPDITVAYTGVPLNVIVACAAGAYSSFSFGDKVEPRAAMARLFVSCVFMGCAFTAITNAAIDTWTTVVLTDGVQAAVGAIVSCLTRFWLPSLIDNIRSGNWVSWLPFTRKSKGDE